jgi:hypothetical protein
MNCLKDFGAHLAGLLAGGVAVLGLGAVLTVIGLS